MVDFGQLAMMLQTRGSLQGGRSLHLLMGLQFKWWGGEKGEWIFEAFLFSTDNDFPIPIEKCLPHRTSEILDHGPRCPNEAQF